MKVKITIVLMLCSLLFTSCFGNKAQAEAAQKEFTVENDAIPPNFGKDKDAIVVVVKRGRRSYDRYLKKAFEENYHGNYEFVKQDDLSDSKYKDAAKYKYLFDYANGSTSINTYANGGTSSLTYKRFFVKDREADKIYKSGAEFRSFALAMKIYAENLEKKRIAEQ